MRNILAVFFFSLLCLCSCIGYGEDKDVTEAWIDAYYEKLNEVFEGTTYLQLVDIDFDEVPELFLSHTGTGGSYIHSGYSFKDGNVVEIKTCSMATDLGLYRNRLTEELIWIASGVFKSGGGTSYYHCWYQIDFTDFSGIKQEVFFEWQQHLVDVRDDVYFYQVVDDYGNVTIVDQLEIDMLVAGAFSGYERIDVMQLGSSTWDLMSENGRGDFFEPELFVSFMQLYRVAIEDNLRIDDNDPVS